MNEEVRKVDVTESTYKSGLNSRSSDGGGFIPRPLRSGRRSVCWLNHQGAAH